MELSVQPLHQLQPGALVRQLVDHLDEPVEVYDEPEQEADANAAEEDIVVLRVVVLECIGEE